MAFKKDITGSVDTSSHLRRAPLVGMDFLHEHPVRSTNFLGARPRLHPKDLVSFLLGHRVGRRRSEAPRVRVILEVFTPSGKPAVQISFKD